MKVAIQLLVTLLLISHAATAQQLDMLASTIKLHLESGGDVNHTIETNGTLLQAASKSGNADLVKLLVEAGADTNLVSIVDDQPPLTLAIRLDNLEILDLLINNGADVNGEDSKGRTPLFKTLTPDRPEARIFLLENGADINKTLDNGITAIVEATSIRNVSAIKQLTVNKAEINAKLVSKAACDYCHNTNDQNVCEILTTPSLAGQHAEYLTKQLGDYHKNARTNYTKDVFTEWMLDDFNLELATYFESLPRRRYKSTSTDAIRTRGKFTYDSSCSSCHGMDGIHTQNKLTPTLAGLNSQYVSNQLLAYKLGERANDKDAVMRNIAADLTREQIFELSEYVQSMY